MILNRQQTKWAAGTGIGSFIALLVYLVYALLTTNGARGGTFMGLVFGSVGTGIIIFECLLGLRKKYPASPLGRVKTWLKAHVWLGLASFFVILLHSGFRWGHGLAAVMMWIFAVIVISGFFGIAMQNYIPRRMTELVTRETIYDEIPTVVRGLRTEADERIEFITANLGVDEEEEEEILRAGGVKRYFDPAQKKSAAEKVEAEVQRRKGSPQIVIPEEAREALRSHYMQEMRPFLIDNPAGLARKLFGDKEKVAAYFSHLRTIMPVASHDLLRDLEGILEERRQLMVQKRLHLWLHTWLMVHVPISYALLVLTAVHAVLSLRY
ncbi:MAG TPA: hypothetical protein VKU19_16270 [Bryobacteraceae bacterium]|nr:hypothetical protein [Bryobacteraceae bacterium]